MLKHVLSVIALVSATSGAFAQVKEKPKDLPEIIHFDGYAFAWQKDWRDEKKKRPVIKYDVVSAWSGEVLVANCDKYQATFKGATWCFANEANLAKFVMKTDKNGNNEYTPFAGGRCTLGASWGLLAARGDPTTSRVLKDPFGDKILILQSHKKWWSDFDKDPRGNLGRAMAAVNLASGQRIVPNEQLK